MASNLVETIMSLETRMSSPEIFDAITDGEDTPGLEMWKWDCHSVVLIPTLGGSTSITVEVQGSHDEVNWWNLDASDDTITLESDVPKNYYFRDIPMKFLRVRFLSEDGGSSASLVVQYMGSN